MPILKKVRPIRSLKIDGQTWYSFPDVCRRLGKDTGFAKRHLKKDQKKRFDALLDERQTHEHREQAAMAINDAGLISLVLHSRVNEMEEAIDWIIEVVANNRKLSKKIIERLEDLAPEGPKINQPVTADEVKEWVALRKKGRTLKEISAQVGRDRSTIFVYTTPKRAPDHIRRAVFSLPAKTKNGNTA